MWDKDTYNFMEFIKKKCEMVAEAEKIKGELPEGTLVVRQPYKKPQYYWQKQISGKSHQQYLNADSDSDLIYRLKKKKQFLAKAKNVAYWKKIIMSLRPAVLIIIKRYELPTIDNKIYQSEKTKHSDKLKETTLHGEKVRSRAEALIADRLFYMGIPYRYEKQVTLQGKLIHPDFTITNPLNGQEVYLEFLGLDTEDYLQSWNDKLQLYHSSGIFEEDRLFVMTDKERESAELYFQKRFTIKRYSALFEMLKITV